MDTKAHAKTWHCGTLTYTRAGLLGLFAFLLWGDFCYTIMQTVVPSILPFKLKNLGASNIVLGVIMSTLPSMLNMTICPYVSFKSDRYRSKWGRRIPFILWTLPFLCLSLIGLGCGEDITRLIQTWLGTLGELSQTAAAIAVIGVFMVAYQFFDMFVASVFWYVFNDVVPVKLLGRFLGIFRIVGGLAGSLYSYFVFKYAESHMREIFIGAAVLYFIGIGMMCLFVKEGEYPPVDESEQRSSRGLNGIKTFLSESFSHKFYWTKFLYTASGAANWSVIGAFTIFFYKDMGLTLEDIGKATGIMGVAGLAAMYFAAIFVDRWHPLRIIMYSSVFSVVFSLMGWVWLFVTLPPRWFFWLYVMGTGLIGVFHSQLAGAAGLPMDMRLQPKSRFGQFCSAQALVRSFATMLAGVAVGVFFDILKRHFGGSDYAYRFCFAWSAFWSITSAGLVVLLYIQWQKLGGDLDFHPPAPWSSEGKEEQEQTPYVGPQTRWLKLALYLINATILLSVLYLIPLTWWMKKIGWTSAFHWHIALIIPIAALLYLAWLWVERKIRADLRRCAEGLAPLDGIPHHGVILVKAAALLPILGVWIAMTIATLHFNMESASIVFGIGNLVTNTLVITAVMFFRRIERGHPAMLDYDGRNVTINT